MTAAAHRTIRGPTDRHWSLPEPEASGVLTCGQTKREELIKVDPETHRIVKRTFVSNLYPGFLAVGAGSVWLATGVASVSQVDPRTNKIVRTIPLGGRTKAPCGIAATRDAIWVAIGDGYCDTIGQ